MRLLAIMTILLLSQVGRAQVNIGLDKVYHAAVGFGVNAQARAMGASEKTSAKIVFGLATGKELVDVIRHKRHFAEHTLDFGFTILGYGISAVMIELMKPKSERGLRSLKPEFALTPRGVGMIIRF